MASTWPCWGGCCVATISAILMNVFQFRHKTVSAVYMELLLDTSVYNKSINTELRYHHKK